MSHISFLTIFLFFIYTYGLGFSVSYFSKKPKDFFERTTMYMAYGIVAIIVISVILNLFKIPLYWWLFLILSLILPIYSFFKTKKILKPSFKLTKTNLIYLLVFLIFSFTLFMYLKGSFAYPYLEDEDPWAYAREMKYIAFEHKLDVPFFRPINYLDPYPPGYVSILGLLHQTSPYANWTIKFFNSLLLSLSILFFFFMAKQFTKSKEKALAATFVLAMLPAYMSHFIWSHSIIPMLFFILIYSYGRIKYDKYGLLTSLSSAAIFLTHPRQAIKLMIMAFLYFISLWIYEKKLPKKIFYSTFSGFIISLSWWAFKFKKMIKMLTYEPTTSSLNQTIQKNIFQNFIKKLPHIFSASGGTATRPYSLEDFMIAKTTNMINNPIGLGFVVCLLLIFTIIMILINLKKLKEKKNCWLTITLLWFLFTFLFVNSATFKLPLGFGAFRMWMLLAIPVALLCSQGINYILNLKISKEAKYFLIFIIIIGILLTSGIPKYIHNTNPNWPAGVKWTYIREDNKIYSPELEGFIWVKNNLPLNSKIFTFSKSADVLYALNMFPCTWCSYFRNFQEKAINENVTTLYSWLKNYNYNYLILSFMDYKYLKNIYGNETSTILDNKLQEILSSNRFKIIYQNKGFILLKVI